MILDDYDVVSPQSEQQVRNAYAAARWRLQYNRRAQCPDLRGDELQLRGERLAARMTAAREQLDRDKEARRARELELQRALERTLCRIIPFPSLRSLP